MTLYNRMAFMSLLLSSAVIQPLYNTTVGVKAYIHVSYPIGVITRVRCLEIQQNKFIMTIWGPPMVCVISKTVV